MPGAVELHLRFKLLDACRSHAASVGVPLDGWNQPPIRLLPGDALAKTIRLTWPELDD